MCEEEEKRSVVENKKELIYRFYFQEFLDAEVFQDAKGEIGR